MSAPLSETPTDDAAQAARAVSALRPSSTRAQDDLFEHVNGVWLSEVEIPEDRVGHGSFDVLREQSEDRVRVIVEGCGQMLEPSSEEAQIAALHESAMDEDRVEALGVAPLAPLLAEIDAVTTPSELSALLGRLARRGIGGPVGFGVGVDRGCSSRYVLHAHQSGLGLPERSYYHDEAHAEILAAYEEHVARMLDLAGLGGGTEAREIVSIETQIASDHWEKVACRDAVATYNLVDAEGLTALLPQAGAILAAAGVAAEGWAEVCVSQPSAVAGAARLLAEVSVSQWQHYLRWRVLAALAPHLSSALASERFEFAGRRLSGLAAQPPRWKRAVRLVESVLGDAVGRRYAEAHYSEEAERAMGAMVENLLSAYRERIEACEWMEASTRSEALEKLSRLRTKIGKPVRWREYDTLELCADDLVGNVLRAAEHEHEREISRLAEPVDREEWHMQPQTVNAYFSPTMNEIVFPAAILQPPFFDLTRDLAYSYGSIGAVIGHEVGHCFDDQGSRYDGSGSLRQWWSAGDQERFSEKVAALVEQYDQLHPRGLPDEQVSGALTVGENIGDLGGVSVAHHAYRLHLDGAEAPVVDGLTGDQRLFTGWALTWRVALRPEESRRRLRVDPHSPPDLRANIVRNVDAFHEAFQTEPGDGMWLDPSERVRIW